MPVRSGTNPPPGPDRPGSAHHGNVILSGGGGRTARALRVPLSGEAKARHRLSEKKWELRQMYSDMRTMRGFSEDCATSPLHRLICALVELTVTPDNQVSEEASRCLGELGPVDLATMILKPEQGRVASKPLKNKEASLVALARHVIQLMVEYLVDPQISVAQAASDALYSVLSTEQGRAAADVKIPDGVQLERSIIVPFYHCGEARGKWGLVVSEDHMSQVVDQGYLWVPVEDCTHDTWITNLVCTLLEAYPEDSFLRQLAPVCRVKVMLRVDTLSPVARLSLLTPVRLSPTLSPLECPPPPCCEGWPKPEELLPLLVDLLLCTGKKICQTVVSKNMRYFFKQHYDGHKSRVLLKQIFFNKPSVQCMLNVVHYIRLQGVVRDNTSQSLDMDYLHVAQAAQFCSAHFTSILYVELWSSEQIKEHPSIIVGDNVSPLDCICDKDPERGRDVEDILREAYTRLQYKDAVSGCGSSYLLDSLTRVSHLELEGQWEQAMQEYQLQSKNDDPTAIQGLCRCLHRMGSHNLLHRYLAATEKTSELLDIQYECGWRLGQWDLGRCPQDDLYEGHHYDALQATEEGDLVRARVSLSRARTCIATTALAHASLESAMNLYPSLSRLQTLQELEDFLNDNPLNQDNVKLLMTRWREQDRLGYGEFEYLELVLAQRLVLLRMASSMFNFNVKDELTYQLEIAALARKEGWPQVAGNCLARLATFSFDKPPCIVLEEARLHWAKGNREVAIVLLKSLLRRLEQDTRGGEEQLVQRSIALHLYGSWMVETKSENPQNIIDQYFLKALTHLEDLAESREKQEICLEAHSSLARFADGQYQNLVHYTKSAVFETKQKGIVEAQVALEKIRKEPHTDEMKKMSSILSRQKSIDTLEVENTEKEKNNYLTLAVKYYCQSLQRGDKHNLQVFRLVSLWLDNMSHEALADILNTELGNIPSYKFLPLLPQLSARISNDANNPFVYKLNKLLERCSVEHPHHTLPVLLSIVNLYLDKKYTHNLDSRALNKKNKEVGKQGDWQDTFTVKYSPLPDILTTQENKKN
uniref:FAT domain-containing protein n=1 Tax=Timema cristinae TaxID=61476 RepID=A0A7R9GUJ2_TIMCR|nr:unnamed protein product [Timema cristinae]